jgi:competence protein ComEC
MALDHTADSPFRNPVRPFGTGPLAPLVLGFCLAILLAEWSPRHPLGSVGGIAALTSASLALACLFRRARRLWLCTACALLVGYGYALWSAVSLPADQIAHVVGPTPVTLEGRVLRVVNGGGERTVLDLSARSVMRDAQLIPVSGRVRLTAYAFAPQVESGDVLRLQRVRLRRPSGFHNPGAFDYGRYLRRRGIHATAGLSKADQVEIVQRSPDTVPARLARLKARLAGRIEAAMPEAEAAIAKEMVLGVRGALPAQVREAFNASGTIHLLSVSGFHVAAVYGAVFLLLRFLFKQVRFRLLHRVYGGPRPSKLAALSALAVVMGYACVITLDGLVDLVDPNFPAIRSTIMIATFVLAYLLDRDGDPVNITLLAALLILVLSPLALFGIGFQLSFVGVLMIFYAHRLLYPQREADADPGPPQHAAARLQRRLRDAVVISTFASLGTAPLILYHFERLPLIAPLANVVIAPVASIAVPIAIVASVATHLLLPLGCVLLWVTGAIVGAMYALVRFFAALPYAAPYVGAVSLPIVLLAYATILALPYCRRHRPARWGAVGGALVVGLCLAWPWLFPSGRGQLHVTFLDVGHGDACFIRFPHGTTMLIDGGGSYRDDVDFGERVVAPFLRHQRVRRVDYVVATHPHPDHAKGLGFILKHFHVRQFWDNGAEEPALWYRTLRQLAVARGTYRNLGIDGLPMGDIEGVRLELLHPSPGFHPHTQRRRGGEDAHENNRSLVLKLTYGAVSFLFTGDIETEAERFLLQSAPDLRSTVLKVPHHGSRTSSSAAFVHAVNPQAVVFSVQRDGRFGHPHPTVVERYRARGAQPFRTDVHGAIRMRTAGQSVWIEPILGKAEQFLGSRPPSLPESVTMPAAAVPPPQNAPALLTSPPATDSENRSGSFVSPNPDTAGSPR